MELDRAAEMLFGDPEIGGAIVLLAETELVIGVPAEEPRRAGVDGRATRGAEVTATEPVVVGSASRPR